MALYIKNLAEGVLTSSIATILPASTSQSILVKSIMLGNSSPHPSTVFFLAWVRSGTLRYIAPMNQSIATGSSVLLEYDMVLEPGDSMQGWTGSGGSLDFVINGIARDI